LPVVVAALTAVFALRRLDDFDTWWHLASGRWIVEHASVPHVDVFSYTVPDHVWINLQWLYDVLLYATYRIGGADLLVVVTAIAFTVSSWIVDAQRAALRGPYGRGGPGTVRTAGGGRALHDPAGDGLVHPVRARLARAADDEARRRREPVAAPAPHHRLGEHARALHHRIDRDRVLLGRSRRRARARSAPAMAPRERSRARWRLGGS
jgi:hypothetical protein